MKLDEKEEQFLYRMKKATKIPLWPTIACLVSAGWIAIFHKDKFGFEGLITIEILLLLLLFISVDKKRNERKLLEIVSKLTE